MPTQTRVVRLLQNHIYPTYQLYAAMSNKQTIPADGLRFAALTVMEWLRQRMGENAPSELIQPAPSQYKEAGDDCLPSLHINRGYVIDIVSRPKQGVWSLQITEPDLGSEPGNPNQQRQAVPGRVIETNVGFCIQGKTLECGFQTVISDPEGSSPQAEVYRLAVVRRLMESSVFGLTHILPLQGQAAAVKTAAELRKMLALVASPENQLPDVVFTYHAAEPRRENPQTVFDRLTPVTVLDLGRLGMAHEAIFRAVASQEKAEPEATEATLPYDAAAFAEKMKGFCRVYLLDAALLDSFVASTGRKLHPGDAVLLEPARFGGGMQAFPYKPSAKERETVLDKLTRTVYAYPRGKAWDFGHVEFLSAARENLLHPTGALL